MAKGFKHGAGGTNPLNFKVIAYATEKELNAATAKENTICVITNHNITSWIFSASQPETPVEGMLWILTGPTNKVSFNALKKNGIYVYPMAAKQYISGNWETKTTKLFQAGGFSELWDGTVYSLGNEYATITGGWVYYGSVSHKTSFAEGQGAYFNKNAASMSIGNGGYNTSYVGTVNEIDLTQYEKIEINVTDEGTTYGSTGRVYIAKKSSPKSPVAQMDINVGLNKMDIITISGEYFVGVQMYNANIGNGITFDSVKLI